MCLHVAAFVIPLIDVLQDHVLKKVDNDSVFSIGYYCF